MFSDLSQVNCLSTSDWMSLKPTYSTGISINRTLKQEEGSVDHIASQIVPSPSEQDSDNRIKDIDEVEQIWDQNKSIL